MLKITLPEKSKIVTSNGLNKGDVARIVKTPKGNDDWLDTIVLKTSGRIICLSKPNSLYHTLQDYSVLDFIREFEFEILSNELNNVEIEYR